MKEEVKARYAVLALRDMPLSCCSGVYSANISAERQMRRLSEQ